MQSFKKKIGSILTNGIEPIQQGIVNFNEPKFIIEDKAMHRVKTCLTCPLFKREPIPFLRIKDERIPEASEMFCDGCGCTMPYKIRQSIVKCEKWNE